MRSEEEMYHLILQKAQLDERIRGVLLNGSRANKQVKPDRLQDFDIMYVVTELTSFIEDSRWIDYFGPRLIMQLPDESALFPNDTSKETFAYLMQFEDGNRIDLTLISSETVKKQTKLDSLTKVLLDKDQLFTNLPESDATDYLVSLPSEAEFNDCINEFWWVSTYVAKGLARKEITYAKAMLDGPVRDMFLLALNWKIVAQSNQPLNLGKNGKFLQSYLTTEEWRALLMTYSNGEIQSTWEALFNMCTFFIAISDYIELKLKYKNKTQQEKVLTYLEKLKNSQ
ncbi:aminoglycoside 6-adenylyltransferase [Carnobacterium maltaromaticum]|uniref:aminoglycoside 6-adenylyltransferase n=1 Tax=Carnobacterium maltaromaticum TaxID=2751 RepID=UPI0039AEF931